MEQNKPYAVEFLSDALNDMSEIIAGFVMLGAKQGAARIKDKMNKAALNVSYMPYAGIAVRGDILAKYDMRMVVVEKYLMFYRIFEDDCKVVFYRVLNGKRNYPMFMARYLSDLDE